MGLKQTRFYDARGWDAQVSCQLLGPHPKSNEHKFPLLHLTILNPDIRKIIFQNSFAGLTEEADSSSTVYLRTED